MPNASSFEKLERLNSMRELEILYKRLANYLAIEKPQLVICAGTACHASGSKGIIRVIKQYFIENQLQDKISLKIIGCHGFCEMGPSILVKPQGAFYPQVKPESVPKIVDAVIDDDYVEELIYSDSEIGKKYYEHNEIPFFKKQVRSLLESIEYIDPIRIYEYLAHSGYKALLNVLGEMDPSEVIKEVTASKIRGRGGAGFPTGVKWEMLANKKGYKNKYIICNADEGDPGAYMDGNLLAGNPNGVIEGMIIGAYATGATEGVVYVRNEYPLSIKNLSIALRQARDMGLLGKNILGTGFDFDIRIVRGAGAFVCGEETALIRSVEGKVGEPRQRPPYPVEEGLYGQPTIINNVETWANIPLIIRKGGKEYAKIGTKGSTGTKIFSLVGKIKNTGLVEVPMGMTIKEIVYDIGGGSDSDAKIKAVQTGGPSGGCIPVDKFDLPIDYDSLNEAGSIMGSGGMIVMDEKTCMVDVAKYFVGFLKDESCGKCFTCRKGTQRMYEILDDITSGRGSLEQLDLLEELALVIKDTTMCGLGQTAPNPVLSTLRYFRNEYIEHIKNKRCEAGVCKDLVGAPCQSACPIDTEAWRYIAHIARGEYEDAYLAIREANPFPSVCARVCSHPCEKSCRAGTVMGESVAIRALKRFVTDKVDPNIYKPKKEKLEKERRVAVVGAGPSGLTAAHKLSLLGYKVSVFERAEKPGGMLVSGIPSYRLPKETLQKEIDMLIDENVTLECNKALGRDFTIRTLFDGGFKAVYLAMGAHKSKLLDIEGEDLDGVFPALDFLKSFNMESEKKAKGKVGVIGGGDSAVDAARVALRQKNVESVAILYRRTRKEMPALQHEIDAAIDEGVDLKTLVSPVKIESKRGKLKGVVCVKNKLGDVDSSGRRRPEPIKGSEELLPFDTLIVTIGDTPDVGYIKYMEVETSRWGTIEVNEETLETNIDGVFAGGDVVTGPNTVVDAIAAGKKAAVMMDRYVNGEKLAQPMERKLPEVYVAPPPETDEEEAEDEPPRVELPTIPVKDRKNNLKEVEKTLSEERAKYEALRCMRCDLEFTYEENKKREQEDIKEQVAEEGGVKI